jgi:hypothetical protein
MAPTRPGYIRRYRRAEQHANVSECQVSAGLLPRRGRRKIVAGMSRSRGARDSCTSTIAAMESVAGDRRPTGSGISRSVPGSPSREGYGAGSDHWQFRRLTATSGSARTRGATSRPAVAIPADASNTDITRAGIERGDRAKFDRIVTFADALPRLRRRVAHDLKRPGLPQEKVIARIVRLLDTTSVRVGQPEYAARQPDLRSNHAQGRSRELHSRRPSGVRLPRQGSTRHRIEVADARIADIVRSAARSGVGTCSSSRMRRGKCRPVNSRRSTSTSARTSALNSPRRTSRTWAGHASSGPIARAHRCARSVTERAVRAAINEVVRQVAQDLHNTPAVCRRSYICPTVFDDWRAGKLPAKWSGRRR